MKGERLLWYRAVRTVLAADPADDLYSVHYFPLEENPKRSNYPALTSLSWFRERAKPKHISISCEPLYHVLKLEKLREERRENYSYEYEGFPHYYHKSLWSFYAAIGYDRKTKKWGASDLNWFTTREVVEQLCHRLDPHYADIP